MQSDEQSGYVQHYDSGEVEPEEDMVPTQPEVRQPPRRGDGFDVGSQVVTTGNSFGVTPQEQIIRIVQNPGGLRDVLGLDEKQVKNVTALVTGGTASAVHRVLAGFIGDELAGAAGGFLGGFIARKMKGR